MLCQNNYFNDGSDRIDFFPECRIVGRNVWKMTRKSVTKSRMRPVPVPVPVGQLMNEWNQTKRPRLALKASISKAIFYRFNERENDKHSPQGKFDHCWPARMVTLLLLLFGGTNLRGTETGPIRTEQVLCVMTSDINLGWFFFPIMPIYHLSCCFAMRTYSAPIRSNVGYSEQLISTINQLGSCCQIYGIINYVIQKLIGGCGSRGQEETDRQ